MTHPNAATPEEMRALIAARRTDDESWFNYGDVHLEPSSIVNILSEHLTERRRVEIETVLDGRTHDVVVVVDGMIDMGNVSAIMRTAEGFGVQSVHSIDTSDSYKRSRRTTRGADKWVDRYRWEEASVCFNHLHKNGYRILAAEMTPDATPLSEADLTSRIGVVFGNEREGISPHTMQLVDGTIAIPMEGFVESFNVSVAASIVLHEIYRQRVTAYGKNGDLTGEEIDRIRAVWYLKSVRGAEAIVQRVIDGVSL